MYPFPVPYILRWSSETGSYQIDPEPTAWVQYQAPHTVAAVRRQLARYDAKQEPIGK